MKLDKDIMECLTRYFDGSYWYFSHILEMALDISDKTDFDLETIMLMSIAVELSYIESSFEDVVSKLVDLDRLNRQVK